MAAGGIITLVAAMDMGSDYSRTHCFNGYMLLAINATYQTTVRPAVSYGKLNMSCHAFADQMTLARYYYHESEYHLKSIGKLVHLNKFTGDIVWGPLDELGDDIDLIDEINRLPKLNDIDDIPLSQLIKKLHRSKIVTMTPVEKRHRYVTFTLEGLMILIIAG